MRLVLPLLLAACGGAGTRAAAGPGASGAPADTGVRPALSRPPARGDGDPAPVLRAMKDELDRTVATLGKAEGGPYFVAYQVTESRVVAVRSSFGAIITSSEDEGRILDVDVRVGDHRRDNTHPLRDQGFGDFVGGGRPVRLPMADDAAGAAAIRAAIWLKTADELRAAQEQLVKVKAQEAVKVKEEDDSDDFSRETPVTFLEQPAALTVDRAAWEKRLNRWSALFRAHPDVHASEVTLAAEAETRYVVSSEGTLVQSARTHLRVFVEAETVADDGMELRRYESFDAPTDAGLPAEAEIEAKIAAVIADLEALRRAPIAEPYVGPAILDGDAAGVFFHEVFGHRVEGHRLKDEEEGQTFASKVGQPIMPDFIDVFDDPTVASLNGVPLSGFYRVDDEGVLAQRASLVEGGVLKTFLLSRAPVRGFVRSNGHGRRQEGFRAVSRQGNLVVAPRRTVSSDELKRLLLAEVKRQGKPYGLRFRQVEGGFTMTARFSPQAFKVIPVLVTRIYPDGREELIRGADLEGTPLLALSKILAAADDWKVFNGVCGAESGWVPVSGSSPSLLVGQVEIARKEKGQDKPPILPAPPAGASAAKGPEQLARALRDELARAPELRLPGLPAPSWIGYQVVDIDRLRVSASLGAPVERDVQGERYLRADVRVGDFKLDSSNFAGELGFEPPELLQREDDYDALRHEIWHVTDRLYKHAAERLEKKRALEKGQAPDPERVGDFTPAQPVRTTSPKKIVAPDAARLEALVTGASAVFQKVPELHAGKATVTATTIRRLLLTSEGTLAEEPRQLVRLTMTCHTQADDGMRLDHEWVTTVGAPGDLPSAAELVAAARRMADELLALRKAPPGEAYTGPVLFEAPAAAQLLRALLVDELAGTPAPLGARRGRGSGTQLAEKVGLRILPSDFRVEDDPSLLRVGGYAVDDEGVPAQKVTLVDKGMLKGFLMSRAPRKGFERSNGHGRAGVQGEARGTPSNLVVTADKGVAEKELKKRLLARAKADGLKYAIVIRLLDEPGVSDGGPRVVVFGDDDEDQRVPRPLLAVKVGLDGKEEPLRGLAIGALPLRTLKNIAAAGREPAVQAWMVREAVPATLAAPALLFDEIELVKANAQKKKPPTLPRP